MKKLILALTLLFPLFAYASSCTTATTAGAHSLEIPSITKPTLNNEYLNHGFNGTLLLNANGTASFSDADPTGFGIVGNGATWSVTTGCVLTIDGMNFYNLNGGIQVANIIDNMDFRLRRSEAYDDSLSIIVNRWVGRLLVQNTNNGNQWTGATNSSIHGSAVVTRVMR